MPMAPASSTHAIAHMDADRRHVRRAPPTLADERSAIMMRALSRLLRRDARHQAQPRVVAEVLAKKSGFWTELAALRGPAGRLPSSRTSPSCNPVAAEFEQNTPDATLAGIFGNHRAWWPIPTNCQGRTEDSGKVTMMTLHTAKGLEYPVCVPDRHGARHIPTSSVPWKTPAELAGGAPSRLRGHHSREASACM